MIKKLLQKMKMFKNSNVANFYAGCSRGAVDAGLVSLKKIPAWISLDGFVLSSYPS